MSKMIPAGIVTAYGAAVRGGYLGTYEEFCTALGDLARVLEDFEGFSVEVETLEPGSSATASYSDGVLALGIPKGDTGNGIALAELNENYTLTLTWTNGESTTVGPIRGAVGATPDFSIGTVTTGAAGSSAEASITGTPEEPVLNLTIPKGDPGEVPAAAIAPTEASTTASQAYAIGDYFWLSGTLYEATAAITQGGTIVVGTNCKTAEIGEALTQQKNAISQKEDKTTYTTLSGTTVTQTGEDHVMYLCGELATLSFTAPQTGITAIRFSSGTTATVVTLTGVTMPDDWEGAEANKTYEINVLDGKGVYASWS